MFWSHLIKLKLPKPANGPFMFLITFQHFLFLSCTAYTVIKWKYYNEYFKSQFMYFGYALNEPDTRDVILQIPVRYILHLENKHLVRHIQNEPMNDQWRQPTTEEGFSLVWNTSSALLWFLINKEMLYKHRCCSHRPVNASFFQRMRIGPSCFRSSWKRFRQEVFMMDLGGYGSNLKYHPSGSLKRLAVIWFTRKLNQDCKDVIRIQFYFGTFSEGCLSVLTRKQMSLIC